MNKAGLSSQRNHSCKVFISRIDDMSQHLSYTFYDVIEDESRYYYDYYIFRLIKSIMCIDQGLSVYFNKGEM